MRQNADIAVYGADGALKLLVEAKNKTGATRDWAKRLRRNMYAHRDLPEAPYFLLVLPDRLFLWHEIADPLADEEPVFEEDASEVMHPYLGRWRLEQRLLDERSLELALTTWLDKVTSGYETESEGAGWLSESGLLEAIRGGRVETQTAV